MIYHLKKYQKRYPEIIYPEIEEFKKFLNKYNINNLKTYEIKIQIYIIILFYIYFAYSIDFDIYLDILEIQCILFYKKIEKQKWYGKLREKKKYSILLEKLSDHF